MMKKTSLTLALTMLLLLNSIPLQASSAGPGVSADEAMQQLKEGNARYAAGAPTHPSCSQDRRTATATGGQHPYVTILSCSDSRVPVEILFDKGLGEIFVVRVAGNVVDTDEAGSIEYGVDHLATPLMVVLGHTHCGAVTAVVQNAAVHGNIPPLVDNIKPAVAAARAKHPDLTGEPLVEEAVKANIWQGISDLLRTSAVTRERVKDGRLKVVGALYDIDSGKVEWLGSHPDEEQLLKKFSGEGSQPHHKAKIKK